jgi:hypothetical protein
MNDMKLCSACQTHNPIANTLCEKCGTPLVALLPARITVRVPDVMKDTVAIPKIVEPSQRFEDVMGIYIVGQTEPVMLDASITKILIGRFSPGESAPTIDLTPFDAHLFGVSRQHAMIFRSENGVFLQDLGSTNGTWLNDKRLTAQKLYEMKSGDLIRLGQLGMRCYFETLTSEYTLTLSDERNRNQRLTPAYLESRLSPYLIALTSAQTAIDMLLERPASMVTLLSITSENSGVIKVQISGGRDIVRLIETRFNDWRLARMIIIDRLRDMNEQVKGADPRKTDEIKVASEPMRREIREQLLNFVNECVESLAPDAGVTALETYVDKLLPPFQALLFSPLQPLEKEKVDVEAVVG